jgi:hypothetical protein
MMPPPDAHSRAIMDGFDRLPRDVRDRLNYGIASTQSPGECRGLVALVHKHGAAHICRLLDELFAKLYAMPHMLTNERRQS